MLLTARNHPLADKLKVNLTDIKDENYIYSEDGFDFEAGGIFEQNDIHPTVLYQLDDDVAVQKMVSDGWESVYYRNYCCPIRHLTSASAHLRSITNGHWAWHI